MKQMSDTEFRDRFLAWQCRIRQIAMRKGGGRPTEGMRPRAVAPNGRVISPAVTILLVRREPEESTGFFRYQLRKTKDPRLAYERGLAYLQSNYFQYPTDFSDEMTALFVKQSAVAATLIDEAKCLLEFTQFSQNYKLRCTIRTLSPDNPACQATVWHNRLFNPNIPSEIHVLAFRPDWQSAQADPAI